MPKSEVLKDHHGSFHQKWVPMKPKQLWTLAVTMALIWFALMLSACSPAAPTATPAPTSVSGGTVEPSPTAAESGGAAGFSTAAAARTPIPTPTPNTIERAVDDVAERIGLSGRNFLGLTTGQWAELAGAGLVIAAGYFVARLLVDQFLKRIVDRTKTRLDDEILTEIRDELRWLVIFVFADFAITDISFLGDTLRTTVNDLFFLLNLFILTSIALGLIKFATNHYKETLETQEDQKRLDPIIVSIQRFAYFIILILALSIGLAHFGANANALYITLLVTGLIISLAARDIISDLLSGFIILADQPFHIGDSVHIRELDTWGDVLDIGTRTTRIRTKDNREIIVPNSQIAKSQIVNYNYPDSKYRLDTYIGVEYGVDIARIRKTATEAVRNVSSTLDDEPVDVLFIEFNNSARKVRVRWWVASFHEQWHAIDAVNVALESAFEEAHIDMPYETYDLRVRMEDGDGVAGLPKPSTIEDDPEAGSLVKG